MDNIPSPSNNVNVLDTYRKKSRIILLKNAAAGDLPNEKIKMCYICNQPRTVKKIQKIVPRAR